jgi:hypothetical protein
VRIGIRLTNASVLDRFSAYLPSGTKSAPSHMVDWLYSFVVGETVSTSRLRRYHLLYAGSQRLMRAFDFEDVLEAFEQHLHLVVALNAPHRLFVRAGVVGWRDRAILVVGPPRSGTSTLVAALVRAGATYYSDRFAVLDTHGRVYPHTGALWFAAADDGIEGRIPIEAIGGRRGDRLLPVGLIVTTGYEPNRRWFPRPITPGRAVMALLRNTPLARIRPTFALRTLASTVGNASVLNGRRGEATDIVRSLLARVDASHSPTARRPP